MSDRTILQCYFAIQVSKKIAVLILDITGKRISASHSQSKRTVDNIFNHVLTRKEFFALAVIKTKLRNGLDADSKLRLSKTSLRPGLSCILVMKQIFH